MVVTDYRRILPVPKGTFFLFGARGTGKSTWLRKVFANAVSFTLLDETTFQDLLVHPGNFSGALRHLSPGTWVVVDEVQRLPHLLNEVHRAIEERKLKFALTGSSARKLRRAGVNLLAGRATQRYMFPFVPEEMGDDFQLDAALQFGTMPIVVASELPEQTLRDYVQIYLREEIQAEALVRNLGGFARFLPIASLFHGQILNTASLSRDAGVARTTVTDYLSILEDTHLAYQLQPLELRLRVRERRHPKLYWIDSGIVRELKKARGPVSHEEKGALFEGLVGMLLRAYGSYREHHEEMNYWASTESRVEVDFVLTRGRELCAIEAKAVSRLRKEDTIGLEAIAEIKLVKRRIMVYMGTHRLRTESGIDILPFGDFAADLANGSLWK